MTPEEVALKLIKLDKAKRSSALANGIDLYLNILFNIANDIYSSCIEDYYSGYTPTSYNRHGNIEGINLYKANSNGYSDFYLSLSIEEKKLDTYSGKRDVRGKVLKNVMSGLRGTGLRSKQFEWPMPWSTSYPNSYSVYRIWYSKGSTIKEILDDFCANVARDTSDLLWQCIERQI